MNARVENLFGEIFFLAYGFEYENCLSELADVTGQLKTTCTTLENAAAFGILLLLDKCSKSFITFCSIGSPLFLSTVQTALQISGHQVEVYAK